MGEIALSNGIKSVNYNASSCRKVMFNGVKVWELSAEDKTLIIAKNGETILTTAFGDMDGTYEREPGVYSLSLTEYGSNYEIVMNRLHKRYKIEPTYMRIPKTEVETMESNEYVADFTITDLAAEIEASQKYMSIRINNKTVYSGKVCDSITPMTFTDNNDETLRTYLLSFDWDSTYSNYVMTSTLADGYSMIVSGTSTIDHSRIPKFAVLNEEYGGIVRNIYIDTPRNIVMLYFESSIVFVENYEKEYEVSIKDNVDGCDVVCDKGVLKIYPNADYTKYTIDYEPNAGYTTTFTTQEIYVCEWMNANRISYGATVTAT